MSDPAIPEKPEAEDAARVTTTTVAANLRILSVKLDDAEGGQALLARVDRIVSFFLENHWRPPRRFYPIMPLSFLLQPAREDPAFAEDVAALTAQLEKHLFGEGVEIRALIGDAEEMAALAGEPDIVFIDAHEAAVGAPAGKAAEEPPPISPRVRRSLSPTPAWLGRMHLFAGYDVRQNAVLCYVASLGAGQAPATLVDYDDLVQVTGARLEDVELAALRFAARKVVEQTRTGGAVCYCIAPLSYETLSERKLRDAYVKSAGALPAELRRFILPSVFGGPAGPSSSFLMETVGALRTVFSNVDWRTRSCSIDLAPLRHAQVFSTTLVLPTLASARRFELARLPGFVKGLGSLRIRSAVTGVSTRAELDAIRAANAHYVSGPAVSAEQPSLAPRAGLSIEALPLAA